LFSVRFPLLTELWKAGPLFSYTFPYCSFIFKEFFFSLPSENGLIVHPKAGSFSAFTGYGKTLPSGHSERSEESRSECFQDNARFLVACGSRNDKPNRFFRSLFGPQANIFESGLRDRRSMAAQCPQEAMAFRMASADYASLCFSACQETHCPPRTILGH